MNKIKAIVLILLIAGFSLYQFGCSSNSQSKTTNEGETNVVIPVEVAQVIAGDISAYFSGTATLEAEEETDVVAKVGGVVEKIYVEEGQYVDVGQILAKLDDEKISVQLKQAEANFKKLENDFNRSEKLFQKNLISNEEFQRAKFEFESQKAAFDLAKLNLDYTSIRSPISGIVAERKIKVGNMVQDNQAIYKVTSLDPLLAVLHVPERQMDKLQIGHKAILKVDAIQGDEFVGQVELISPIVDPTTGTVKITVEMHDPSKRLKPGMFARVNIIYNVHKNAMLIPKDAIMTEDKESSVFVVKDSLALRQFVEIGYVNTTKLEILNGVNTGDLVVTTGKTSLKDSSKVELVYSKAKQIAAK